MDGYVKGYLSYVPWPSPYSYLFGFDSGGFGLVGSSSIIVPVNPNWYDIRLNFSVTLNSSSVTQYAIAASLNGSAPYTGLIIWDNEKGGAGNPWTEDTFVYSGASFANELAPFFNKSTPPGEYTFAFLYNGGTALVSDGWFSLKWKSIGPSNVIPSNYVP